MTSNTEFDPEVHAAKKIAKYICKYVRSADALVADRMASRLASLVSSMCNLPVFELDSARRFANPVQIVLNASKSTRFVAPTITCARASKAVMHPSYPYAYCVETDTKQKL